MGFSIRLMMDEPKLQILTFNIYLPRQAPVHNPYYSALYFYACALSLKELNETHLHINILIP
jgi:hypothetical protein